MKKKNKYFADYLDHNMEVGYAISACSGNYLINDLKSAIKNYDHFVPENTKDDKLEIKGIHPKDVYDELEYKNERDIGIIMKHPIPLTKADILKRVHHAESDKLIGKSINIPMFKKDNLNKALKAMTINPVVDKYEKGAHKVDKFFHKCMQQNLNHNSKNSFSTKSKELKSQSVKPKKITQPSTNNKKKQRLLRIKRQQRFHR